MSNDAIIVVPYDATWPDLFLETARPMRQALGDIALRIYHIGSTSIPEIAAKPIIDIQICVASFEQFNQIEEPLASLGYVWRSDNTDKSKRYFRESGNMRRTHIHVHKRGSFQQQFALLFRDYLRQHPEEQQRYAAVKYELAEKYRYDNRLKYVEGKSPIIWEIMARATKWLQKTGWEAGESDV